MNPITEKINTDLKKLIRELNFMAKESLNVDPLVQVTFSFSSQKENTQRPTFEVLIDRNSGGSIHSDYAIQDSINIILNGNTLESIVFSREMMETDRITDEKLDESIWDEILKRIRSFCVEILPHNAIYDEGAK